MAAIVILGAAVWPNGPSPTLRRRTLHAAQVWARGGASHIIPCGGIGKHGAAEALVMRDILIDAGVPAAAILPEAASTTTQENIALALPILRQIGTDQVIIVTDWPHAPRARLVARRLGLRATSDSPSLRGARIKTTAKMILREIAAYLVYLWRR